MDKFQPGDRVWVVGKIYQWMYDGLGSGPWNLVVEKLATINTSDSGLNLYMVVNINNGRNTGFYAHRLELIPPFTLPENLFVLD